MAAATHYLRLGYLVFWPAVRAGPVDFVVDKLREGLFRVQVKTATWITSGTYRYLQARTRSSSPNITPQSGHYDTVFVVHGEEMWEIPAKNINSSNICLRGSRPGRPTEAWDGFKVR